ncbi:NAD-dependent epimerase/dehydratase family protein [Pantoea sp. B65]|uniref:NAD-dependent epimerase/dehydratase family protein n=1 Tax=Pantoea sp. B65 TaxID=2813359 RepID=UPI0039B4A44C
MGNYTLFGGNGFIGSEIYKKLTASGHQVDIRGRSDAVPDNQDLGNVIYCAGNGNCVNAPFDVFRANTELLAKILENNRFEHLLYMSSTRVYMNQENSGENDDLTICSDDKRRLFNLTKLVAEELLLRSGKNITIVRPGNVYGLALNSPLFLPSIIRNAINNKKVDMYVPKHYAKDYVSVDCVAEVCCSISASHQQWHGQIINVAAGYNITAEQIGEVLVTETGCDLVWHDCDGFNEYFPETDIALAAEKIDGFRSSDMLKDLRTMIQDYKNNIE